MFAIKLMKKRENIVPFLFGIEKNPIHYSWIFYKYMDFALKNGYPIIADEAYFVNPSVYEKQKEFSFQNIVDGYNVLYEFKKPTDEDMKKVIQYPITKEEKATILSGFADEEEAIIHILQNRDEKFEEMISSKFEAIQKEHGKIVAVLSWTYFPSLEFCCQQLGIQLITLEQTTFRPKGYRYKFGYFQFYNKYDSTCMDSDYQTFLREFQDSNQYFSRKELLSLFLADDQLKWIDHLDDQSEYDFGLSIGPDYDPLASAFCNMPILQVLNELKENFQTNQVLTRVHPMQKEIRKELDAFPQDHSSSSLEWILKCRRVISIGSNVAFEAMLLGKTSYVLGENFPYHYGSVTELKQYEERVADLRYINYIIFGYYVPYSLMFDRDYIYWRLTNPSVTEIYQYHLDYVMKAFGLSKELFDMAFPKRLQTILETHSLKKKEITTFVTHHNHNLEEDIQQLRHELSQQKSYYESRLTEVVSSYEEQIKKQTEQYNQIINSKSWKVTKPLRFITNRLAKLFGK